MSLQPGDVLQNRYRVVRTIKSGGMGCVYEALDTKLADSPCAVKEILEAAQSSKDADYIQSRFYEEMKALSALDHPGIPKVRDYSQEDGAVFIVMDLVRGRSLEEELQERVEAGQPAEPELVVKDLLVLLDILDYLHQQPAPIVHRDVKPANILRDPRNRGLKLVDFGLARTLSDTATQTMVGTLGYCAPEQLMGRSEPRSDLYSAGATLHRLLTGEIPAVELYQARKLNLPDLRPGLALVVEKATQPMPEDRYASASDMAAALRAWLADPVEPVVAAPKAEPDPAPLAGVDPQLVVATTVPVVAPQPTVATPVPVVDRQPTAAPPVPIVAADLEPANRPGPLASPWRRLGAGFIDTVLAWFWYAFTGPKSPLLFLIFLLLAHTLLRLRTPGRAWLGLSVVDPEGGVLSRGEVARRTFLSPFSVLLLGAGLWTALRDPERRSLHDRWVGSLVCRAHPSPWTWRQLARATLLLFLLGAVL